MSRSEGWGDANGCNIHSTLRPMDPKRNYTVKCMPVFSQARYWDETFYLPLVRVVILKSFPTRRLWTCDSLFFHNEMKQSRHTTSVFNPREMKICHISVKAEYISWLDSPPRCKTERRFRSEHRESASRRLLWEEHIHLSPAVTWPPETSRVCSIPGQHVIMSSTGYSTAIILLS